MRSAEGLLLECRFDCLRVLRRRIAVGQSGRRRCDAIILRLVTNRLPRLALLERQPDRGSPAPARWRPPIDRSRIAASSAPPNPNRCPERLETVRPAARPPRPLASLLAHSTTPNELLPHLHQHALDVDRRRRARCCSSTTRATARCRPRRASASTRCATDPWLPGADEAARGRRRVRAPRCRRSSPTPTRQMPDLAARLETPRRAAAAADARRRARRAARGRLRSTPPSAARHRRRRGRGRRRVRHGARAVPPAPDATSCSATSARCSTSSPAASSATLNLAAGLDIFCHGANRLFGADRTSVWIHDRRARHLVLQASSDPADVARGVPRRRRRRRRARGDRACAGRAPRSSRRPSDAATAIVTVPLRGCRRALGTIVFEGVRVETGGELDLLDRADELGRQLSSAIENMQLLDDVMRSRRELENTFDSISHLVAVSDIARAASSTSTRRSRRASDARARSCSNQPLAEYHRPGAGGLARPRTSRRRRGRHGESAVDHAKSSIRC